MRPYRHSPRADDQRPRGFRKDSPPASHLPRHARLWITFFPQRSAAPAPVDLSTNPVDLSTKLVDLSTKLVDLSTNPGIFRAIDPSTGAVEAATEKRGP